MQELFIYSPRNSNRLAYTLKLVFGELLGLKYRFTLDLEGFKAYSGPRVSYGEHPISDEFFIYASRLLFERGVSEQYISVFEWEGSAAFYGTHPRYILPFDPLAASFYLVSRYEEYLPHRKDQHQRFMPSESLASQKGFLRKAVVNSWAHKIGIVLQDRYPELEFNPPSYRFIPTVDVDCAFAYRNKGFMRNLGGYAKELMNLDFGRMKKRSRVLAGIEKDPFDTFDELLSLQEKYGIGQLFFFLMARYGENDKNIAPENRQFQALIKSIADYSEVAIHPSFASGQDPDLLRSELARLTHTLRRDVRKCRQHFLRIQFPETYRRFCEVDLREDYSMGYTSEPGFRAGICSPFNFYDLDAEVETGLRVFPFALMDITLKDYLRLEPLQAIALARELVDEVKKYRGSFISVWHNQSFSEEGSWAGWGQVYEDIIQYALPAHA